VAAFNCYWDPYAKFHAEPVRFVFGANTNYPLLTMFEVDRVPSAQIRDSEAILVGDSRTYQLTPVRTATVAGLRVLNLGVGGGSFEETLSMLAYEGPRLKGARVLVLDVPMERFTERLAPDRCREAMPVASSLLRYAVNWQTCQDAWKMALYRRKGVTTAHVYTGAKAELTEVDQNLTNYWREMFRGYDPETVRARLKLLRETIAPWQARGAKIVFWAPPLRKDLQGFIAEYGLEEAWQSIAAELRQMGPLIDLERTEGLPALPFTFADPVHSHQGREILEHLLRDDRN
jgi:hypothetical protein